MKLRFVLWAWLLDKLQAQCSHPPEHVTADILEGAAYDLREGHRDYTIQWCRLCGAYRFCTFLRGSVVATHVQLWRRPRPLWADWAASNESKKRA